MPWRIICGFIALFVLTNAQQSGIRHRWDSDGDWKTRPDNLIDIDVERNSVDQAWPDFEELSGSGSGMDNTDDEDLLGSGSGSGAGLPDLPDGITYRPPLTTSTIAPIPSTPVVLEEQLTPCEKLREASQHLLGNYVPRCKEDGKYDSLQCHGYPGSGTCWCADLGGREIPGTARNKPIVPDCDAGNNLPPCVFKLVQQSRMVGLGVFRPKCTLEGDFELTQCSGSLCYCVHRKTGEQVSGTEVFAPDRPLCDDSALPDIRVIENENKDRGAPVIPPMTPRPTEKPVNVNVNIDEKPEEKETVSKTTTTVSNDTGDKSEIVKEPSSVASLMSQPGILAAVVGGCVVFLLCAILLVMFIVYRMKKKDEGSYALDEPKKLPNYSYQRAPDKEFYA